MACVGSCVLGALAPVPCLWPGLSCVSLAVRRRVMMMYNFAPTSQNDACESPGAEGVKAFLCVPCALRQEYQFLLEEEEKGRLRFPWEKGECVPGGGGGKAGGSDDSDDPWLGG
jgi:hypothetical protein